MTCLFKSVYLCDSNIASCFQLFFIHNKHMDTMLIVMKLFGQFMLLHKYINE
jgi:hypothetical protein